MDGWNDDKYDCTTCKTNGNHKVRNCSKYFPNNIQENPPDRWQAVHRTAKGDPYFPNVSCDECPVSYISDTSMNLIQLDIKQKVAQRATNVGMFATQSDFPSRWLEAFSLIEIEKNRTENGLMDLERESRD